MSVSYETTIIGEGNHASLHIPDPVLAELGANRRAPLRVTNNGYTYQSTATGVGGECRVVFPQRDRAGAGVASGEVVIVVLELDSGYREVEVPDSLADALAKAGLSAKFEVLSYSRRREFARSVAEAKAEVTREKRIQKVLDALR